MDKTKYNGGKPIRCDLTITKSLHVIYHLPTQGRLKDRSWLDRQKDRKIDKLKHRKMDGQTDTVDRQTDRLDRQTDSNIN